MEERIITTETINGFKQHLIVEEKSEATIEKYLRDVKAFVSYMNGVPLVKKVVIAYKQYLIDERYAIRSINSMLASLNSFFCYSGWNDLKVKSIKLQQEAFRPEEKELSKKEYERLCNTAQKKHNVRLSLILQTICSTGIRVGELPYITVEAVICGKAEVSLKGKTRVILLPAALQRKLRKFAEKQKITEGSLFVTRSGKPINRSVIWREMKGLCKEAKVNPSKVFPHNLRHLFARIFYDIKKDIVKLADVLGHSNVNTTRIYIASTGLAHRRCIEQMHLVI